MIAAITILCLLPIAIDTVLAWREWRGRQLIGIFDEFPDDVGLCHDPGGREEPQSCPLIPF